MIENLDQNQIIFILTAMAASAVVTGFMAGFFGIGGGLIMVPILFYIFSFAGVEQTFVMHLALGTSFSIIIPTSIISTMTHMKYKAVDFNIVKTFGAFVAIGVITGTIFAISLKTSSLVLFFSIMTMLFSIYFLTVKDENFFDDFKKLSISQDYEILSICKSGARSQFVSELLEKENYKSVNILDGFDGWEICNLPRL